MASVFTRVEIYNRMKGGTLVTWEIHPLFSASIPWTFKVQVSRSATGGWVDVATATDTYIVEDIEQRLYGKAPRLHYRVILTDNDGNTYDSGPTQIIAALSDNDWRLAGEMIRKETLRLQKLAGQCGFLYKRRRWGTPCTVCRDYDTGEVKNAHCETCLGTGFVGGYFEPVAYWVAPSTVGVRRRTQTNSGGQGVIGDRVWAARGMNCPWLDTHDVWVDYATDQRYIIQSVQEVTFRKYPILFDPVELRLAPVTDIVYSLERPDDQASSST